MREKTNKAYHALGRFFAMLAAACIFVGGLSHTALAADATALTAAIDAEYTDPLRLELLLIETDYTPLSWAVYKEAITQAIELESSEDPSEQDIDSAIEALGLAKIALIRAETQALLDAALANAESKQEALYTPESWSAYLSARADAEAMPEDTDAGVAAKAVAVKDATRLLIFSHHTVTYDSNGGSVVAGIVAEHGAKLAAPKAPTKARSTFGGWFQESGCTTPWDFDKDRVTSDITLIAKWTAAAAYKVTAKPSDTAQGIAAGSGSYYCDKLSRATVTAQPKAGYRFVRWREGTKTVSTSCRYSFAVGDNRTLVAEFAKIGVPSISAASSGYNRITVKWKAVTGAAEYEIYRAITKSGKYTRIGTSKTTSYTNTGLTAGSDYYFKVRAKCVAGSATYGIFSAPKSAKPLPVMPKSLKAQSTEKGIKLSWKAAPGASKYEIYVATSAKGSYKKVKEVSSLSYTGTGLKPGAQYYYKVRVSRVGSVKVFSGYTSAVSAKTPPAAPTKLSASQKASKITLSWKAVKGAQGYEVYSAGSKSGKYKKIADTGKLKFAHTGLKTKTHYYKIRAYFKAGNTKIYGSYSAVKSAMPLPEKPTGAAAATVSGGIKITWREVDGASRYEVYRATSTGGKYTRIREVSALSFTDTTLSAGAQYHYKVRVSRVGSKKISSAYSSSVTAKTPPSAPEKLKVKAGAFMQTLSWKPAIGAARYEVYRASAKSGTYEKVADTNKLSVMSTGLKAYATYFYKVRAYYSWSGRKIYGKYSPVVSGKPNGKVEMLSWFEDGEKEFPRFTKAVVIDVETGRSFNVWRFCGTNHADSEPLTANDTAIMKELYGGAWSWDRRAIWVKIGDRYFAASMHGMPHSINFTRNNNFPGHFCIHFLHSRGHGSRRECPLHQEMIKKAFDNAALLDKYLEKNQY